MINITDESPGNEKIHVDVCIIGSGPAGISLARYLKSKNLSVAVIERGERKPRKPKRDVKFGFDYYDGIFNAVAFGLGGTSSLWGGQLLPLLTDELKMMGPPWNSQNFSEELFENYRTIERWLKVNQSSYDGESLNSENNHLKKLIWNNFFLIISKWVPFNRRNLGFSWSNLFKNSEIFLSHELVGWDIKIENDYSLIKNIICNRPDGKTKEIYAHHYAIAAGALDTPLILQKLLGISLSEKMGIGNYLHDHISLKIGEIDKFNHSKFELLFSPFFQGNTMRSIRFYMPPITHNSLSDEILAYCHFVISSSENCGFAIIRNLFRALQQRDFVNFIKNIIMLPSVFRDIIRIVWTRYIKNKLALPRNSKINVYVDFVQPPKFNNKIKLNQSESIIIDWCINQNLLSVVSNQATLYMQDFWKKNKLNTIGNFVTVSEEKFSNNVISNIHDIYHPAGTCATGRVLDSDFRVLGFKNLYVLGSAAFPTLGRSNPTLTIMALSLRLGKMIYKKILNDERFA